MGKWAARLESIPVTDSPGDTAKAVRTGLLAAMAALPDEVVGQFVTEKAKESNIGDDVSIRQRAVLANDGIENAVDFGSTGSFPQQGFADVAAAKVSRRVGGVRDVESDDRVSCAQCWHYRGSRCGNFRNAGLTMAPVGKDFAGLLQRCAGFR